MHMKSRRTILTCLALLLGLATAASAAYRQTHLGSGMALQPAPDGTYALPVAAGATIPLAFDPGATPFELADLSFDPGTGALAATFRHVGEKPVSAWAVELSARTEAGERLGSALRTDDWSAGAEEADALRFRAAGVAKAVHERGLFYPGQTHRVELGVAVPRAGHAPPPDRLVLSVPVTVFADTSLAGSRRLGREILAARKAAAEELAYWSVRLEEAAEGAASDEEAAAALEGLLDELEASASALPHSVQAVRANLRRNLAAVPGDGAPTPQAVRKELRSLSDWTRSKLEGMASHVPRELPEAPEPEEGGGQLRERTLREGETDETDDSNCDCGGEMFTSVAQHQIRNCNGSATGWRVTESWSYTCRHDDGSTIESGSGTLEGVGGCIEGVACFSDTYCPPFFSAATETEDFENHIWTRSVINSELLVGTCTARCNQTTSSSLTFKCPCAPMRAPGCTIDGCPILIETGSGGFRLTDLDGGVRFDLDADGSAERVSWTLPGTGNAWLALDRNGNGVIDDGSELFGEAAPQPASDERNGFAALAVFDHPAHGGDGDGSITERDAVYADLLLWLDRNHDGVSDPTEIQGLAEAGIVAIELDYVTSRRRDRHGNEFRYAARVWLDSNGRSQAVDVFLLQE